MARIISFHSFRGGTGKSNSTANVAALLAMEGYRVGVIDADIQSPGIHVLFGLAGKDIHTSLNDYLWERCELKDIVQDLTLKLGANAKGALYLMPSSIRPGEIALILREGYDTQRLIDGLHRLIAELNLDILIMDTHPGLNEETLLSLVVAEVLVVVMRPDQQDYEGTEVTVRVAEQLMVPQIMILVNKTPPRLNLEAVRRQVQEAYGVEVAAVIAHSDEMMELASSDVFVLRYPNHPVSGLYRQLARKLAPTR
jgi:MinD-like ATPase involved in chromosome partitioning or flagellar assembly